MTGSKAGCPVSGFDIVTSPVVPAGTVYVGALGLGSIVWYPTARWDPPHPDLGDVARRQRETALAFLANLLDEWCDDLGLDPEETWWRPHNGEVDARRMRELRGPFPLPPAPMPITIDPTELIRITGV